MAASPIYSDPFMDAVSRVSFQVVSSQKQTRPYASRRIDYDEDVLRMMAVHRERHYFEPTKSWLADQVGIADWQVGEAWRRLSVMGLVSGRRVTEKGWRYLMPDYEKFYCKATNEGGQLGR